MAELKQLSEFNIAKEDIWVIFLDGNPVQGYGNAGFETKRSASSSFNYRLRWLYRPYGFSTPAEMRKELERQGRLQIVKIN